MGGWSGCIGPDRIGDYILVENTHGFTNAHGFTFKDKYD